MEIAAHVTNLNRQRPREAPQSSAELDLFGADTRMRDASLAFIADVRRAAGRIVAASSSTEFINAISSG